MFELHLRLDTTPVTRQMTDLTKRVLPYATRTALNVTGKAIKEAERQTILKVFEAPTPGTVDSVYFKSADKADMRAWVWIKDEWKTGRAPIRWMLPQIEGGRRNLKAFEQSLQYVGAMPKGWHAIPGKGAVLDRYGNVSRGLIRQILSQLRAQRVSGFESRIGGYTNDPAKRVKSLQRQGFRVFALPKGRGGLPPGIYSADLFGRNLNVLFVYVQGSTYRARFPFYDVARRVSDTRLSKEFHRSFNQLAARFSREGLR
jgi:hypothetical protein